MDKVQFKRVLDLIYDLAQNPPNFENLKDAQYAEKIVWDFARAVLPEKTLQTLLENPDRREQFLLLDLELLNVQSQLTSDSIPQNLNELVSQHAEFKSSQNPPPASSDAINQLKKFREVLAKNHLLTPTVDELIDTLDLPTVLSTNPEQAILDAHLILRNSGIKEETVITSLRPLVPAVTSQNPSAQDFVDIVHTKHPIPEEFALDILTEKLISSQHKDLVSVPSVLDRLNAQIEAAPDTYTTTTTHSSYPTTTSTHIPTYFYASDNTEEEVSTPVSIPVEQGVTVGSGSPPPHLPSDDFNTFGLPDNPDVPTPTPVSPSPDVTSVAAPIHDYSPSTHTATPQKNLITKEQFDFYSNYDIHLTGPEQAEQSLIASYIIAGLSPAQAKEMAGHIKPILPALAYMSSAVSQDHPIKSKAKSLRNVAFTSLHNAALDHMLVKNPQLFNLVSRLQNLNPAIFDNLSTVLARLWGPDQVNIVTYYSVSPIPTSSPVHGYFEFLSSPSLPPSLRPNISWITDRLKNTSFGKSILGLSAKETTKAAAAKAAAAKATEAAAKAAAGTAVKTGLFAASGPLGWLVGLATFVIPGVLGFIASHKDDFLGLAVGGISTIAGIASGLVTTIPTAIGTFGLTTFGTIALRGQSLASLSTTIARTTQSLIHGLADISVTIATPLIVITFTLPIVIALFLIVINNSAYVLPTNNQSSAGSLSGYSGLGSTISCFNIEGFSTQQEQFVKRAAQTIASSACYNGRLCGSDNQSITVRSIPRPANWAGYARTYGESRIIEIYQDVSFNDFSALYTLAHESGHVFTRHDSRYTTDYALLGLPGSDGINILPTYPLGYCGTNQSCQILEDQAEIIADYFSYRSTLENYPNHYTLAQNVFENCQLPITPTRTQVLPTQPFE